MQTYRTIHTEQLAAAFHALANPHRLAVFRRLLDCCGTSGCEAGEPEMGAYVGQLGRDLGVAPSTVSHHIKELRQAGLICLKRRGRNVECRVETTLLRELAEFFAAADSCCTGASARRECP